MLHLVASARCADATAQRITVLLVQCAARTRRTFSLRAATAALRSTEDACVRACACACVCVRVCVCALASTGGRIDARMRASMLAGRTAWLTSQALQGRFATSLGDYGKHACPRAYLRYREMARSRRLCYQMLPQRSRRPPPPSAAAVVSCGNVILLRHRVSAAHSVAARRYHDVRRLPLRLPHLNGTPSGLVALKA